MLQARVHLGKLTVDVIAVTSDSAIGITVLGAVSSSVMPLRRGLRWSGICAAGLVVASVALQETNSASGTARTVVQIVGAACAVLVGFPLACQAMLVLVSLDPYKPRYWRRQKDSTARS